MRALSSARVVIGVLALAGCGGSRGDGSAATEVVEVGTVTGFDASPDFGGFANAAAYSDIEGALVAWSEYFGDPSPHNRIVGRVGDTASLVASDEIVLDDIEGKMLRPMAACASAGGTFVVTWEEELDLEGLPDGIYTDIASVRVSTGVTSGGTIGAITTVDDFSMGSQGRPHVACLKRGGFVIAFGHRCTATEIDGIVRIIGLRPEACNVEPPDGVYFRLYDDSGSPIGPASQAPLPAGTYAGAPSVAPLSDGGFLLLAPHRRESDDDPATTIYRYAADGTLLGSSSLDGSTLDDVPGFYDRFGLQCDTDDVCAAVDEIANGIIMHVLDGRAPARVQSFYVREHEILEPPPGVTELAVRAHEPSVACDRGGRCMVTYKLVREEFDVDVFSSTDLGVFAAVYDLHRDVLGPETKLTNADVDESEGPFLTSTGTKRFLVFFPTPSRIEMRSYELR